MTESYTFATVKAVGGDDGPGEFEAILSTSTLDRDGEVIAAKAFDPLPESIPIYCEHDWKSGALPVGRGVPFYDGDVVKLKGRFATSTRAQEVRALVTDGTVDSMSVGFLNGKREMKSGARTVTSGELFECSLSAIPINTTAKILAAKSLGAGAQPERTVKAVAGSWEQRSSSLYDGLRAAHADADWVESLATFDDNVVYQVHGGAGDDKQYRRTYTFDGTEVTLDDAEEVEATESLTVTPKSLPAKSAESAAEAADTADIAPQAAARLRLLATT
jgi:HK97 family phage prohead protease